MFERAAEMAKEMNEFTSLADLYTAASQAFFEAGRPQAGTHVTLSNPVRHSFLVRHRVRGALQGRE